MKQPNYSPQEALERVKLMMGYDLKKTLSENKEKINTLSEATPGSVAAGSAATAGALGAGAGALGLVPGTAALTGAGGAAFSVGTALGASTATGALALGAGVLAGAAGLVVLPLAYWLINKDTGDASRVKKLIQMCSSQSSKIAKLPRKINDRTIRNLADKINDAVNYSTLGFMAGTDEESLFDAFKSLRNGTASDACALVNRYNTEYGDLYDDLDGDIDSSSEWKQIYRPLRDCVEDSLMTIKDDAVEEDCKKNPKQSKCSGGKNDGGKKGGGKKGGGSKFKSCKGTYTYLCMADAIKTVQACLGLVNDGKWGDKTNAKLKSLGYTSFTDADIQKICGKQSDVEGEKPEVSGEDIKISTSDANF
jgi:hypothetical protein